MARLLVFLSLFGGLAVLLLGAFARRLAVGTPGERPLTLRRRGYGEAELAAYLARLGPAGRKTYLKRVLPVEGAFAVAYGLAGVLYGRGVAGFLAGEGQPRLALLAYAAGGLLVGACLADLAQGRAVGGLLRRFPRHDPALARRAGRLTALKWALGLAGAAGLAALTLAGVVAYVKG